MPSIIKRGSPIFLIWSIADEPGRESANRAGARLGPRAVRGVERIGPYEHALRIAPAGRLEFADVGDVPMKSRFSLDECHADIEAFYGEIARAGVIPLSVGGDHSITLPILKALGRERPP